MRRVAAFMVLTAALLGCGDDNECTLSETADGSYTLPVGDRCLRDVSAGARVAGAWSAGAKIDVVAIDDGGYELQLSVAGAAEGFELTLPDVIADRMLHQGYQSWSFTGNTMIPRSIPMDDDGAPQMQAARTGDPIDEAPGVAYYATLFRAGTDGDVLIVAALSADVAATGIAATTDGQGNTAITVLYGPQRETLPTDGQGDSRSETLYLGWAPTPEQAMDKLRARLVAARANSGFSPKRPPGGWFSWNERFADIDEAFITDHAAVVGTVLAPLGMPLVEVDDGWERQWGDWTANANFPNGMEAVAADITGRGLVAGIWLAPFLVDVRAAAAQSDPSLFVSGPDGNPLIHVRSGSTRQYYVLDGTNPDSMAIVTDEIARLAAAGFTLFKLDFLYAGVLRGGRSADVTGIQAMREGLQRIRDAAGPNAIINACGAPTLPVIGIADSLRIGPDTAFEGFDLNWSAIAAAARNLATRAHLFPLVWLDADQAQLRPPYTTDEARAAALTAALAGPAYALGDDLTTLDSVRLALATDSMVLDIAATTEAPQPQGLMDQVGDETPASPVIEAFRYFEGYAVAPPARFRIRGASGTEYEVAFDWADGHSVTVTPLP